MAAGDTQVGTGTTVVFGTSAYSAELLDVRWGGINRASVPSSHMGSTNGMTFIPGKLYDPGEISLDYHFKDNASPPITGAAETITITFPDAETWAASGFVTGFEFTDPMEDKMVATVTVKMTGDITF